MAVGKMWGFLEEAGRFPVLMLDAFGLLRRRCVVIPAFVAIFATCQPALSQTGAVTEVDLELVLAVDISRSMDFEEQVLQREGYASALTSPEVMNAIKSGLIGQIALTYVEWAGAGSQAAIVPWQLIDSEAASERFANTLREAPISAWLGTSISGGLRFSAAQFEDNGYRGIRRTIDVSGDGPNNQGGIVTAVRDQLTADAITINGLPIMLKAPGPYFNLPDLDVYFEECVVGGPGSFVIPVRTLEEWPDAIRRKLVLEIAAADDRPVDHTAEMPLVVLAQQNDAEPYDCLIGEKLYQLWLRQAQ